MLVVLWPVVLIAQLDVVVGDHFAYRLQVWHAFLDALAGKHEGKLLTTVTIGPTATGDLGQFTGYQAQDLVTDIVAMGIVEFLEVINVGHRQHIAAPQALHAFIECASPGQACELITKGHLIGLVRHRRGDHQHHLTAHDVQGEGQDEGLWQHPENTDQPNDLRGMQRPGFTQVLHHEHHEGNEKHRVGQLDQAHPMAMQRRPANFSQPT
ncbi:hypothetical protein D3C81_1108180 [compost metagenome]